jgi:RNA polymerase sigma-70 factor (ECF subfamily)
MIFRRRRNGCADSPVAPAEEPARILTDLDRRYRRPLVSYFEKRIRESYDIDDLVQEVFIRLTCRSQLENIDYLDGYVFEVAANVIRDRLRRKITHHATAHDSLENSPEPTDDFSPERVLIGRQLLVQVIEALEELPARTRQVFILTHYEEMRQEDVAARLGLSVSGVRFLLRQAKAHLARRLEQNA